MLSIAEIEDEEAKIDAMLSELSDAQRSYVETLSADEVRDPKEYRRRLRGFFFGWHHFYLNNWIRGAISVALLIYAIAGLLIMDIRVPAAILLGYWLLEIPAALRAERFVRDRNVTALRSAIGQLKRRR